MACRHMFERGALLPADWPPAGGRWTVTLKHGQLAICCHRHEMPCYSLCRIAAETAPVPWAFCRIGKTGKQAVETNAVPGYCALTRTHLLMSTAGSQAMASAIDLLYRHRLGARIASLYTPIQRSWGSTPSNRYPNGGHLTPMPPPLPCNRIVLLLLLLLLLVQSTCPARYQSMTQHSSKNSDSTNSSTCSEFEQTAMVDNHFAFLHAVLMTRQQGHLDSKNYCKRIPTTQYTRYLFSMLSTRVLQVSRAPVLRSAFSRVGSGGRELVSPKSHKPIASVRWHVFVPYFAVAFL